MVAGLWPRDDEASGLSLGGLEFRARRLQHWGGGGAGGGIGKQLRNAPLLPGQRVYGLGFRNILKRALVRVLELSAPSSFTNEHVNSPSLPFQTGSAGVNSQV